MSEDTPLDLELNGYVDGVLDDETMAAVERYLKQRPEGAARVRDYLQQKAHIRSFAQDPAATTPSKAIDALGRQLGKRLRRRLFLFWPRVAVIALLFSAGWMAHSLYVPLFEGPRYTDEVIQAHILAAAVPGDQQQISADVVSRMLTLIGEHQPMPDLSTLGFRPVAAKLVPSGEGPVLHVTYRDIGGTVVSYFVLHDERRTELPRHVVHREGVNMIYWQHQQSRFAVAAPLTDEQLAHIADLIDTTEPI
jgi:anti-sigma factor RsiW